MDKVWCLKFKDLYEPFSSIKCIQMFAVVCHLVLELISKCSAYLAVATHHACSRCCMQKCSAYAGDDGSAGYHHQVKSREQQTETQWHRNSKRKEGGRQTTGEDKDTKRSGAGRRKKTINHEGPLNTLINNIDCWNY